jgi:hypothetical protein
LIAKRAGEWLFDSVYPEWMKAILSTCSPRFGKIDETILPHLPLGVKAKGDFIKFPTAFRKKPVVSEKDESNSLIDLPSAFSSPGL